MTRSLPEDVCLTAQDALILDFDGTLAPLQNDPDSVFLESDMEAALLELCAVLKGAMAILSGRDVIDLAKRTPRGLWRLGNHGLCTAKPGEEVQAAAPQPDAAVLGAMETLVGEHPGARLEIKGPVLAIHYRAAPHLGEVLKSGIEHALTPFQSYRWQHGKYVLEAKPLDANKGRALTNLMDQKPFTGRRPVMIGDDTTDEDAFLAAQALGGLAIKVGEGHTAADFRVPDVADVHAFLKKGLL